MKQPDTISFDNHLAQSEGWAVFVTTGTGDIGDFRIERIDELARFESDEAAWEHVIQKALMEQSDYHLSALQFIERANPTEFERIETHAAYIGIANGVSWAFPRLSKEEIAA